MSKFLTIGIGGAIVYWLWQKKSLLDQSNVAIKSIGINGDILNPEMTVTFAVTNPTNSSQTITKMWGTLLVNGTIVLGDVIQSQPFTIAANATTDYPVAINLKYAGIFTTIQNYLTNNTGTYTFNGYVTVYGIDIPLLLTYKL